MDIAQKTRNIDKRRTKSENLEHIDQQPVQEAEQLNNKLTTTEIILCFISTVSLLIYLFYQMYQYSSENEDDLKYVLSEGWKVFGSKSQDLTDYEWSYIRNMLSPSVLFLCATYVIVCRIAEIAIPKQREKLNVLLCLLALFYILDWKIVVSCLTQAFIGYLLSRTRSVPAVWLFSLVHLSTVNFQYFLDFQEYVFSKEEIDAYIFYTCFTILKYTSFSLEVCRTDKDLYHPETKKKQDSLMDLLSYMFYLPLFLTGPIHTYNKYREQMNQPITPLNKHRLMGIMRELFHYLACILLIEVSLHFLYFSSLTFRLDLLETMPISVLGGVSLCSLLFFQLKYMAIYGIPRAIALFDGVSAPYPPMCIMVIYRFRDMWRYFDCGLHVFLVRYIYVPIGGSQKGIVWTLIGTGATFAYVCFWHGAYYHVILWAIFNWLGIVVEILFETVGTAGLNQKMISIFSGQWHRRLAALIITPQYMALALANLVYLGGADVCMIQLHRLVLSVFKGEWRPLACMFTSFYCVVQLSMEAYSRWGKEYLCKKQYYVLKENKKQP